MSDCLLILLQQEAAKWVESDWWLYGICVRKTMNRDLEIILSHKWTHIHRWIDFQLNGKQVKIIAWTRPLIISKHTTPIYAMLATFLIENWFPVWSTFCILSNEKWSIHIYWWRKLVLISHVHCHQIDSCATTFLIHLFRVVPWSRWQTMEKQYTPQHSSGNRNAF